jgi:CubicO group peptidase (beta-lactamase class C family)
MTCRRILVFLLLFMWHGEISPQPNASASVNEIPPQTTVERNGAEGACTVPGPAWSHIAVPEDAGWSSEKLSVARNYADSIHSSSVMIVQRGKIVEEWGDVRKKITSLSVRKSLISALYGVYSAEGAVDVNETLEQLVVNDSPDPLNRAEQQARVVDLLRARSGVYHPVDFETDYQKKTRPARGSHPPGTFWFYNNWDFNALGSIFEKKTGLKIGDAFAQRIAKPIGMQDFRPDDVYYLGGPVSVHSAYMFEMTARDMARFGQLYLCRGRWRGRRIVPEDWVEKSSHAQEMVKMGDTNLGGYEYLWWVEYGGVHLAGGATLPGMYSAQGAGGHYILIVPSLDLVIVHRFDNEPQHREIKAVLYAAQKEGIYDDEFGHLVKLILDAKRIH